MADLIINGKNALTEWGVRMGDKFLDELGKSAPLKDYVTNNSRLSHGVQYASITPKVNEQSMTLQFTIEGSTREEFLTHRNSFYEMLYGGDVAIQVPANGNEIYHLKYINGVSYGQNVKRTRCRFAAKFQEPNPRNRS